MKTIIMINIFITLCFLIYCSKRLYVLEKRFQIIQKAKKEEALAGIEKKMWRYKEHNFERMILTMMMMLSMIIIATNTMQYFNGYDINAFMIGKIVSLFYHFLFFIVLIYLKNAE